ncbi:ABC transporter permease [Microtetraspora niveoalba]|uniref:ABC transporter permease n=1 Tax=Microtetraspora niveoalba TaxID=46175 RepID=UPI00082B4C7B|nr:ABC transporter permease [Microtetraspora niveoalba]
MITAVLVRVARAVLTLFLAVIVVFLGIRMLPGDIAVAMLGQEGNPDNLAQIRAAYGLDDPIWVQFGHYLGQVVQGNLGRSSSTGLPVAEVIGRALPVTLELAVLAMIVAIVIGVLFGVAAATNQGRPADWAVSSTALFWLSVPSFWLGMMGILLLSIVWPILPASGFIPFFESPADNLRHLVMPAAVLGTGFAAIIMRQTRSSMLDALSGDYIRTAKAKGLSRSKVVFKHALRNSLIVVITVVGLQLGALISGAVITEQVFVIPGIGKLTIDAIFMRDYPMIQGVVIVVAGAYILINLLTDLLYTLVDPRIRLGGGAAS